MKNKLSMNGWATFFRVIAALCFTGAVLCLIFLQIPFVIALLSTGFTFVFFSKLCVCVSAILENQDTILRRMDFLNQ